MVKIYKNRILNATTFCMISLLSNVYSSAPDQKIDIASKPLSQSTQEQEITSAQASGFESYLAQQKITPSVTLTKIISLMTGKIEEISAKERKELSTLDYKNWASYVVHTLSLTDKQQTLEALSVLHIFSEHLNTPIATPNSCEDNGQLFNTIIFNLFREKKPENRDSILEMLLVNDSIIRELGKSTLGKDFSLTANLIDDVFADLQKIPFSKDTDFYSHKAQYIATISAFESKAFNQQNNTTYSSLAYLQEQFEGFKRTLPMTKVKWTDSPTAMLLAQSNIQMGEQKLAHENRQKKNDMIAKIQPLMTYAFELLSEASEGETKKREAYIEKIGSALAKQLQKSQFSLAKQVSLFSYFHFLQQQNSKLGDQILTLTTSDKLALEDVYQDLANTLETPPFEVRGVFNQKLLVQKIVKKINDEQEQKALESTLS